MPKLIKGDIVTGNTPSNYPAQPYQQPDSAYVQQVENWNHIQDGVNGYREAREINEQIARQIGHVAVQGTSQPR